MGSCSKSAPKRVARWTVAGELCVCRGAVQVVLTMISRVAILQGRFASILKAANGAKLLLAQQRLDQTEAYLAPSPFPFRVRNKFPEVSRDLFPNPALTNRLRGLSSGASPGVSPGIVGIYEESQKICKIVLARCRFIRILISLLSSPVWWSLGLVPSSSNAKPPAPSFRG